MIGEGEPCFIVAEAGVNHNGKLALAKKLIDEAKKASVDAIKFQVFSADRVITKMAKKAGYQKKPTERETQYEMLKKLELCDEDFRKLAVYARKKNIIFLASVFDTEGADLLEGLEVPAFKIPSGELTNFPLLEYVVKKGKPMIVSTGMAYLEEVGEALKVIRRAGGGEVVLLHCVSNYPARVEEINLKAIVTMKRAFKVPVGLSDHTLGILVPVVAVALGACVIEKHFTLSRKLPGPDHKASLEPAELREMILRVREIEKAMGNGEKKPIKSEESMRKLVRRSIVAGVPIQTGTIIKREMLAFKRPGTGLPPMDVKKIVGMVAKKNIKADELITLDKLSEKR
jgi:N-acetylneuraminate synthase/N,N'-diacetyllegionaminate synthase